MFVIQARYKNLSLFVSDHDPNNVFTTKLQKAMRFQTTSAAEKWMNYNSYYFGRPNKQIPHLHQVSWLKERFPSHTFRVVRC